MVLPAVGRGRIEDGASAFAGIDRYGDPIYILVARRIGGGQLDTDFAGGGVNVIGFCGVAVRVVLIPSPVKETTGIITAGVQAGGTPAVVLIAQVLVGSVLPVVDAVVPAIRRVFRSQDIRHELDRSDLGRRNPAGNGEAEVTRKLLPAGRSKLNVVGCNVLGAGLVFRVQRRNRPRVTALDDSDRGGRDSPLRISRTRQGLCLQV